MSKLEAQQHAIELAKHRLSGIDLAERCKLVNLPQPVGNELHFRAFGKEMVLKTPGLDCLLADANVPVKPGDQILLLHYLLCEATVKPAGDWITFRDLPGGQFYWEPFLSRSVNPLIKRIGNDSELLKKNLQRFDFEPVHGGDFAARIHAIGNLYVCLIYHLGDDEFGPGAEFLFDSCIRCVYPAEDAAFLASRICLELL